jgi:glycosyltransferase involved in cell wall biosynthesis
MSTAAFTRAVGVAEPRVRVAHLVSHPIQYFAPLYRELAQRPELDLTVFFYSDLTLSEFYDPDFDGPVRWDTDLTDGYRWKVCPSAIGKPLSGGFLRRPNWDIAREVASKGYDVVWVHGYGHPTTWLAAAAARVRGSAVLIREEATLLRRRPWFKRVLKEVALRTFFSQAGGLFIGEQNRRYLARYGIPEHRLFRAQYCVDNVFFQQRAIELAAARKELRRNFGLAEDAPVVLFCGKLTENKQPLLLIEAFAQVRKRSKCSLLLVGDGPLRGAAEELIARRDVADARITGFLNQSELPRAYAAADMFVLPSLNETWGLVVNEAMNFGLPIVVTDGVGCADDLVRPGWNGFVLPAGNAMKLEDALLALVTDRTMRADFGARSRSLIDEYSIAKCADGIVAACLAVAGRRIREGQQSPRRRDELSAA